MSTSATTFCLSYSILATAPHYFFISDSNKSPPRKKSNTPRHLIRSEGQSNCESYLCTNVTQSSKRFVSCSSLILLGSRVTYHSNSASSITVSVAEAVEEGKSFLIYSQYFRSFYRLQTFVFNKGNFILLSYLYITLRVQIQRHLFPHPVVFQSCKQSSASGICKCKEAGYVLSVLVRRFVFIDGGGSSENKKIGKP